MSSTASSIAENRFVRRAVLAAGACLFVFGLAACGGGSNDLSRDTIRSYCTQLKDCVGESTFNMTWDSVDRCVNQQYTAYNASSGACRDATAELYRCQTNNFQCMEGSSPDELCPDKAQEFVVSCEDVGA
jgi:hypothetical protein